VYNYQGTIVSEAKATIDYQSYGVLYNWPASLDACPEGWHLPNDQEFVALTDYLSNQPAYFCNNNSEFIAKALASTTNWNNHSNACAVGNDPSTNNATGFSSLPGGYRSTNGSFYSIDERGYWWSSTENSSTNAWLRYMNYSSAVVTRYNDTKGYGFSVLCLKN
jgi:uncharacterized protein (TIGR02145 family)